MVKKRVTLYLEEGLYEEYKCYCENNSMVISRKVESLIKDDLKRYSQK